MRAMGRIVSGFAGLMLATLLSGCGSGAQASSSQTQSSPSSPATLLAPTQLRGVVTRFETSSLNTDEQWSILPDMEGQDLATYINNLEAKGINTAIINVQPSLMPGQPQCTMTPDAAHAIATTTWSNYEESLFLPDASQSSADVTALQTVRGSAAAPGIIPQPNCVTDVTVAQRNDLIVQFLIRLKAACDDGSITVCKIKFILDDREWFRTGLSDDDRTTIEERFASDVSTIINAAQNDPRHLDTYLYGVRLKEHNNGDPDEWLPITVDLATRINVLTNNWLKTHTFIVNGGYFGADYTGIQQTVCPVQPSNAADAYQFSCTAGASFPFFPLISAQTAYFAFGYKWMEFTTLTRWGNTYHYMSGLGEGYCSLFIPGCKPSSMTASDWKTFMTDDVNGLGFADLQTFINNNGSTYANWANVVFVGDSSDSLHQMMNNTTGTLTELPQLQALHSMFQTAAAAGPAGTWNGRIFTLGYKDPDSWPSTDDGMAILYIDRRNLQPAGSRGTGAITPETQTTTYWHDTWFPF